MSIEWEDAVTGAVLADLTREEVRVSRGYRTRVTGLESNITPIGLGGFVMITVLSGILLWPTIRIGWQLWDGHKAAMATKSDFWSVPDRVVR